MKRRFAILIAVIAALFTTIAFGPSMTAQSVAARASIPFAFTANSRAFSAGCYKIELQSANYVILVDCDTGKVAGLMVQTTDAYQEIAHGSLVFHAKSGGYQLTQVRFAYVNMQSDLAQQPRIERELSSNATKATIEVAMK